MIVLPNDPTLPNNPRIGWQNLLATAASVDASSEANGFPAVNLANDLTFLLWRGSSTAAQTITVELEAAAEVDYLGIARHNLGTAGASYTLQGSANGSDWTTVAGPTTPADNGIVLHEFAPAEFQFWRLQLGAGSVAPQIAVLYLGKLLTLERRIYVGHVPLPFGLKTTVSTGRSEAGQYLGRVVRRRFYETDISMQNIDPVWCRENIAPFQRAIETAAFFWAWRPEDYPEEVGFVWSRDDVNPANQRPNGMMQFDVRVQGIIE